ncbi:MAG: LamG-like jellyroll fold domain-containing protein, partial [Planctomycetota bacterium]
MTAFSAIACSCDPPRQTPQAGVNASGVLRIPGVLSPGLLAFFPMGRFGSDDVAGCADVLSTLGSFGQIADGIGCQKATAMANRQALILGNPLSLPVSFSAWVKPGEQTQDQTLLTIGSAVRFGITWDGNLVCEVNRDTDNEDAVYTSNAIPSDRLTRVGYALSHGKVLMTINGEIAAAKTIGVPSIGDGPSTVFGFNSEPAFAGIAMHAALWNADRSAEEHIAEYSSY